MKLHFGPPPENPRFDPEAEGWARIREPGPILLQFLAMPVAFVTVVILGYLYLLVWPSGTVTVSIGLIIFLGLILFPAHELLHAICFPERLRSPRTVIGVWLSRLVLYAHYDGELSRNRFLIVLLAPFFGLSLVPFAIIAVFQWPSFELAFVSLINGGAAAGDMIGLLLVGLQIPRSAVVRNRGWRSYWKLKEAGRPRSQLLPQ